MEQVDLAAVVVAVSAVIRYHAGDFPVVVEDTEEVEEVIQVQMEEVEEEEPTVAFLANQLAAQE